MIRYLDLAELLLIAEPFCGIDADTLAKMPRVALADSALHAPEAGFGGVEFYPELITKAAVLAWHLCQNHPFPDGNKRTAWMAMYVFLLLNDVVLSVGDAEAEEMMVAVASGDVEVDELHDWLVSQLGASG
ncbi:MAG: type II toxin-antitoxin system death-on-curing family toxin [Acidimicrobiales bacterium]